MAIRSPFFMPELDRTAVQSGEPVLHEWTQRGRIRSNWSEYAAVMCTHDPYFVGILVHIGKSPKIRIDDEI